MDPRRKSLPDVLHRHILSFCDAPDLAQIATVSHYWADKANESRLWEKLAKQYQFETVTIIRQDREENLLAPLIKAQFARFYSPEQVSQRELAEYKIVHPSTVKMIENAAVIRNFFDVISNIGYFPYLEPAISPMAFLRHANQNATVEKMGLFAGYLTSKRKLIKAATKQADSAIETVKNAFCCSKSRCNR